LELVFRSRPVNPVERQGHDWRRRASPVGTITRDANDSH